MQLASIASVPVVQTIPMPHAGAVSAPEALFGSAARSAAPAAMAAPLEGAIDGVARLAPGPIIDFPGIVAGDQFDIVKGSKVGFLGVKGLAGILQLDDDNASFKIKAGAFGIKVDVVVDVVRTGPDTVRIDSRGSGIPDTSAEGRIVAQRTNYAEFERIDDPSERTIISHDGTGGIVIDTVVPTFGKAHLVLKRRA
jgi:hypothetical protein